MRPWLLAAIALALGAAQAAALEREELLLVVNRNVPVGQRLAEFYQNARLVPTGRIVALDLPAGDEMPWATYERQVVVPLRQFLRQNRLEQKVSCIVTFYGVPLRIAQHTLTPDDRQELAEIAREKAAALDLVRQTVAELDKQAAEVKASFAPASGDEPEQLRARAEAAMSLLGRYAAAATDSVEQAKRMGVVVVATRKLAGPAGVLRIFASSQKSEKLEDLARELRETGMEITRLGEDRFDPAARKRMRQLVGRAFGALELLRVMESQQDYLEAGNSVAAVDSELALLWWKSYRRSDWQPNPLYYRSVALRAAPPTLMVSRLDAPQPGQVRQIILASLKAERDGLKGRVVLDSRGMTGKPGETAQPGTYPWYDQSIRNLGDLLRGKTLPVLRDDSPGVLPADSAMGVAVYCGWYSLKNYVPACRFSMGAVGFHVASFELTTLRQGEEKLWVRGLINDGVVATLGPVAEPYLHAFPRADEFFPLLLTGKLSVAEAYWKTVPMTSWMMTLIGDPMYSPYKSSPALQIGDLPAELRPIFDRPATRAATTPP